MLVCLQQREARFARSHFFGCLLSCTPEQLSEDEVLSCAN